MALGEETKGILKLLGLGAASGALSGATLPASARTKTRPSGEKKVMSRKKAALISALASAPFPVAGYMLARKGLTGKGIPPSIAEDLKKIPKAIHRFRRKRRVEKGMKRLKLRVIKGGKDWVPTKNKLSYLLPSFTDELDAIYAASR